MNVTQLTTHYFTQRTTNQTQIIIDDLEPFQIYHCYIVAVTVGKGPYTAAVTVITEEGGNIVAILFRSESVQLFPSPAPSSPPQSVSIHVVDSTSLAITWSPPPLEKCNGIIRKYSIKIIEKGNIKTLTFSTQSTMFNTSILSPFTTYFVKIAAFTVDYGPYTQLQKVTTLQNGKSLLPSILNAITRNFYSAIRLP